MDCTQYHSPNHHKPPKDAESVNKVADQFAVRRFRERSGALAAFFQYFVAGKQLLRRMEREREMRGATDAERITYKFLPVVQKNLLPVTINWSWP